MVKIGTVRHATDKFHNLLLTIHFSYISKSFQYVRKTYFFVVCIPYHTPFPPNEWVLRLKRKKRNRNAETRNVAKLDYFCYFLYIFSQKITKSTFRILTTKTHCLSRWLFESVVSVVAIFESVIVVSFVSLNSSQSFYSFNWVQLRSLEIKFLSVRGSRSLSHPPKVAAVSNTTRRYFDIVTDTRFKFSHLNGRNE